MYNNYDLVTVVNRTSKSLNGTWDGRQYELTPGEHKFPRLEAMAFRYQNPIMGVGSPLEDWGQKSDYLIGIVESGDDCSPIEQSGALQRWDSNEINGGPTVVIHGKGGLYNVRQPLPAKPDVLFTDASPEKP